MPAIPPEDIENRFGRLSATAESVGEKIVSILKNAAHEVNKLVGHASPSVLSIVQRLEQGAHVAVSAPVLQEPHQDPQPPASTTATDPGAGASSESAASPTSQETASPSPSDSPAASSAPSSADSATESKG